MCCLLPDPLLRLWTCHALAHTFFFPSRDLTVVSDPGMWRDSVTPLPGRTRRHEESFMSTSTQTTHINLLPSSHRQTSTRIVVSAISSDGRGWSTHPLDVLSEIEPTEEFSALLSQSFTSRQRICTGGEKGSLLQLR